MKKAVRALPLLLFIVFALFFNTNLVTVRISEMNYLLEDAAGAQDVLNNSMILGRFELLKRRIDQGESRVENYALEARVQVLSAPPRRAASDFPVSIGPLMRPLRSVLNALRFALGKDPIHPEGEEASLGTLEVAYLRERSRNYGLALDGYFSVLPELGAGSDLRATALLHAAFCESMLNSIAQARLILTNLIADNPGKEESAVAWKLLGFLDLLQQERRAAHPGTLSDLARAEQAYRLVDYSTSIDLLTGFIVTHQGDPRLSEAFYFRGRSHEELGEIVPAIEDYHTVTSGSPAGPWSREAQRRLYLLATIYGQGEKVAQDVLGRGARSAGAAFVREITPYVRIIDPSAVTAWLTGSAESAVAPALPPAPSRETVIPQKTAVEQAGSSVEIASVPAEPHEVPLQTETPAEAAATPAVLQPPAGDLLLPPLRLAPNPEPAETPIIRPTLAGSFALLQGERAALEQRYQHEIAARRSYNIGSWVSLGAGVASAGTMGYFLYQAFASYSQYQGATSAAQAKAMREQTQLNSTVAIAAGVVGGISLAAALVFQLLAPQTGQVEDRIRALDDAIQALGQGGR